MEVDDNELTSLTWLHSINILPPRKINISSKRRNDQLKHQSPKSSSEKTNTGVKDTFDISSNTNYNAINEDMTLISAQKHDQSHETILSQQNNTEKISSKSPISQTTSDLNSPIIRKANLLDLNVTNQEGNTNQETKSNSSQNCGSLNVSIQSTYSIDIQENLVINEIFEISLE